MFTDVARLDTHVVVVGDDFHVLFLALVVILFEVNVLLGDMETWLGELVLDFRQTLLGVDCFQE